MKALLMMALRNLARHRKRSALTGLMIGLGALMTVLTLAFSQSIGAKMTDSIVRNYTGNLQIHAPVKGEIQVFMDASDETPFLRGGRKIRSVARQTAQVCEATPRLRFQGLLSNGEDAMGITALGVDPAREFKVSSKIRVVSGTLLRHPKGILLGKEIAKYFKARIGDEYVIVTTTPDGYTNGVSLKLEGIVSAAGMEAFFDDNLVYLNIQTVRQLLYLQHDEVSEVVVALRKGVPEDRVIPVLRRNLNAAHLAARVDDWRDVAGMLAGLLAVGVFLPQLSLVIILIVVAIGIVNTILMAVLERTREVGTMMAIGAKRREILGLFVTETALLSAWAAGLGCLIGGAVIYYLSRTGIPAAFEALEFVFGGKRLYFIFSWQGIIASFVGIVLFSSLVTVLPARMAARFNPVAALRQV